MKKLLVLMMMLFLTLGLMGCGGESSPDTSQNSSNITSSETSQIEFVPMNFGYTTMNVPSVFSQSYEEDEMYISAGPDAAIVVSPLVADVHPSDWSESVVADLLEEIYGSLYTDLKLAAFENVSNLNGNTAVYYAFNGTTMDGSDRLVHILLLYNADLTAIYAIELNHGATDSFFDQNVNDQIINSITLADEAQHLPYEE